MFHLTAHWCYFSDIWCWVVSLLSVEKLPMLLISDSNIKHLTLWRKQFYIVDSSTKCFVTEKHCRVDAVVGFHDNTGRFYSVDGTRRSIIILLGFHGNSCYSNAPQSHVVHCFREISQQRWKCETFAYNADQQAFHFAFMYFMKMAHERVTIAKRYN